ncbi:MAG: hypothetical protein CL534_07830 [Ahrensia sp.]|nr:hypothetical protein [Ahrensia sp.]
MITQPAKGRRPVEAIQHRTKVSAELERRVRKALTKLVKTGAPFTVEDVCNLACVGKTFIYDKRRAELTNAVLAARDASQRSAITTAEEDIDTKTASWRERATNAEALAKELRAVVKERDARIAELTGQLYDPEGSHLADQNAELRKLVQNLNQSLLDAEMETRRLRRSLDASRANVRHERERNITLVQRT